MIENDYDYEDEEDIISKSQIKRELHALKKLGKELIKLSPGQLDKMPISDELRANVDDAKKFKQKALKRQLQRLGVLMRTEDAEAIQKGLNRINKPERQQVKELHKIEQWRDGLIMGDKDVLNEIIGNFPELDHQYLNQIIRNAKKEKEQNKPPKSAKALFQYLGSLNDQE